MKRCVCEKVCVYVYAYLHADDVVIKRINKLSKKDANSRWQQRRARRVVLCELVYVCVYLSVCVYVFTDVCCALLLKTFFMYFINATAK